MTTLTVNRGIGGASYNFEAPEELSTQLAQQYIDAINDAISNNTFQVISPDGTPASDKPVCQVDWNVASDGIAVASLPPGVTNLLIHNMSDNRVAYLFLAPDQPLKISILDAAAEGMIYTLSGAVGGNLTVLQASRLIDVGSTTENWTIAVKCRRGLAKHCPSA